jgi:orotate phosphoribosyltransferase
MTDSDLVALARDVDTLCRLTGDIVLRSGRLSDEYFDKYLFETDPAMLRRVAVRMAELIPADVDLLGGLELGGIPLVTMLSSLTGVPALFVRKQAKTYGTRRLAEGAATAGRRVLLIEDVITTGGAVRDAAVALRADGATVDTVVCAIDRSVPGTDPLAAVGISIRAVMTKDLLDSVSESTGAGPSPSSRA